MLIWLVPASKDQEKNENIATCISIIRCKIIGEEKNNNRMVAFLDDPALCFEDYRLWKVHICLQHVTNKKLRCFHHHTLSAVSSLKENRKSIAKLRREKRNVKNKTRFQKNRTKIIYFLNILNNFLTNIFWAFYRIRLFGHHAVFIFISGSVLHKRKKHPQPLRG